MKNSERGTYRKNPTDSDQECAEPKRSIDHLASLSCLPGKKESRQTPVSVLRTRDDSGVTTADLSVNAHGMSLISAR